MSVYVVTAEATVYGRGSVQRLSGWLQTAGPTGGDEWPADCKSSSCAVVNVNINGTAPTD